MQRMSFLIAAMLLLAACASSTAPTATPAVTVTPQQLAENPAAAEENVTGGNPPAQTGSDQLTPNATLAGDTETYTGEAYAFDYPATWFVSEGDDGAALTSFAVEGDLMTEGLNVTPDQSLMTFSEADASYETQADTLLTELNRDGIEILNETEFQLSGGQPAYRVQYVDSTNGEIVAVFTELNDQPLVIIGYGNLVIFDNILNTLRPADLAAEATTEVEQ